MREVFLDRNGIARVKMKVRIGAYHVCLFLTDPAITLDPLVTVTP